MTRRRRTHVPAILDDRGDASLVEIILVLLISTLCAVALASVIWIMVGSVTV